MFLYGEVKDFGSIFFMGKVVGSYFIGVKREIRFRGQYRFYLGVIEFLEV